MANDAVHKATPMRMAVFWAAELVIIGTLIVTLIYILKHPGPLKEAGTELYPNYDWHAVVRTRFAHPHRTWRTLAPHWAR